MPANSKGKARTSRKPSAAPRGKAAAKAKGEPRVPRTAAECAFVEGLVARGEAVKVKPGQSLPSGATHEIVGQDKAGRPVVVRRRFLLT
jgi:hypothetical protein